jgi:hypothetical protein
MGQNDPSPALCTEPVFVNVKGVQKLNSKRIRIRQPVYSVGRYASNRFLVSLKRFKIRAQKNEIPLYLDTHLPQDIRLIINKKSITNSMRRPENNPLQREDKGPGAAALQFFLYITRGEGRGTAHNTFN